MDSFTLNSVGYEVIQGNYIGVDVTGIKALPNGKVGIRIAGPLNNTIGGTAPGAGNIISSNNGDGIDFTVGSGAGTVIEGNWIGTDPTGTLNLGNSGAGIDLWSNNITIGGTTSGAGNIIAHNSGNGIEFTFNVNENSILSNSIFGNGGLGINFANGPTPNHPWPPGVTPGSGPNNFQNYPVLTSAVSSSGDTTIQGSLNAAPSTTFLVQFFSNVAADPSGYGQGQTYLGSAMVTTDSSSNASFTALLTGVSVPTGSYVTATATDPSGNTSEFGQDVTSQAVTSLSIGVTAQPSTGTVVYVGSTLVYTITLTNSSSEPAPGVVVTDTLDANVIYQSGTSSIAGAKITQSNGIVTAAVGTVPANSTATVTIDVTVGSAAVPQVSNSASVTTTDTNTGSPTSITTVTAVAPVTDLAISSIATTPAPNYAGVNLVYTITAVNHGPSNATGVIVTDTLPSLTDIGSISAVTSISGVTPTVNGNVVTADFGDLASGTPVTVTITVTPNAAAVADSPLSNTATITGNEFDSNTGNNTQTTTNTISPAADLQVVISPNPTPVDAGMQVTYTITATNNGPSDATGVVVTDTIPGDVTFVSATGGVTPDSKNVITFAAVDLANSKSAIFQVIVSTMGTSASPTTDMATVAGDQFDPNSSNDTASVSVPVIPVSDLQVGMTATTGPVYVGDQITYTITASNAGPSAEPAAVLTDNVPTSLSIVSATTSLPGVDPVIVGNVVTADLGSLAVGGTPVTMTIIVTPQAAAAGQVTNSVTISGQNADTSPQNNTAKSVTTVVPSADLAVNVSAPTSSLAGQPLEYTITATNNGPSPATGVTVIDVLPPLPTDVTFVSATGGVTPDSSGKLTFNVGDLAVQASVTLVITVTPTAAAVGHSPLTDTATIAGNEHDPDTTSNTSHALTTIAPAVDLSVTQFTATPEPIELGGKINYTLVVTNCGPSPATALVVTSPLGNATYVAGSGTVSPSGTVSLVGSDVVANVSTLAAGASFTVTYALVPSAFGTFNATTRVAANETDTDTSNNSASALTTVLDHVGTIEFSAGAYAVPENAASATLTVNRVDGLRGTITVNYQTVAINATPGLDYTPVSGTLTFAPGISSQTIVVPVLANPYDSHDELVGVVLNGIQTFIPAGLPGQAILGSPSNATLTIQDIDPNHTPLTVTNVQWTGTTQNIRQIFVTFNKPLIAGTAVDPNNYALVNVGADGRYGTLDDTGVPLEAPSYTSSIWTVTLTPAQPLREPVLPPSDQRPLAWGSRGHRRQHAGRQRQHAGHRLHRHDCPRYEPPLLHVQRRPGESQDHGWRHPRRLDERYRPGNQAVGGGRGPAPYGPLGDAEENAHQLGHGVPGQHPVGSGFLRRRPGEAALAALPHQPVPFRTGLDGRRHQNQRGSGERVKLERQARGVTLDSPDLGRGERRHEAPVPRLPPLSGVIAGSSHRGAARYAGESCCQPAPRGA